MMTESRPGHTGKHAASHSRHVVGVVGPCGSGKSTLIQSLTRMGVFCVHIAQEHSYVKDMWLQIVNPEVLVFLDASFETSKQRKKISLSESEYQEEQSRLSHAREHADVYIHTDALSPDEVLQKITGHLKSIGWHLEPQTGAE